MKIAALIARILLGIMFTVFGLNGFFHFIPQPMPTGQALAYFTVLGGTGYMVLVFAIQLVSGVLFLIGKYVPLALTLIAPVIVNILLFHALMQPAGLGPGVLAVVLWAILFYKERDAFAGIFRA
jgi:putative oxidoreductase